MSKVYRLSNTPDRKPYQGFLQGNRLSIDRDRELTGLLVARDRDVEALVVEHAAQAKLDRRVRQRPPAAKGALGLSRHPSVEAASYKV